MKKLTTYFLSLFVMGAFMFSSCSDPCKDVVCENAGIPVEVGDDCNCECVAGFEGDRCQIETRAKFLGAFTAADDCNASGTASYTTTITNGTVVTQVKLTNFWDSFVNAVVAKVNGTTITIDTQEPDGDGFTVSGNGTISGNTITWNYTITDTGIGGGQDVCSSTWVK